MRFHNLFCFFLALAVEARNCVCRNNKDVFYNEFVKSADVDPTVEITQKNETLKDVHDKIDSSTTIGKKITVLNSCSFDISVGITGSDNGISLDESCPKYQKNNGNGRCFWSLDTPDVLTSGEEWSTDISAENDHLFSGTIWGAKTLLMKDSCPSGRCEPWVGPTGAVTKAEFTLSRENTDYTDISIIEGANLPITMYANDADVDPEDRYDCGVAGSGSWEFTPDKNLEKFVTIVRSDTEETCETNSDCSENLVCGASFKTSPPNYGVCGSFSGIASAHLNCIAGSTGPPFFCQNEKEALSCQGEYSLSGYNSPIGSKVCGCPDWEEFGIDAPPVAKCTTSDKHWEEKSLPFLIFLKKACPLCYSYAYDDMSSTVTCDRSKSYTVEFCPNETEKEFFF